MNLSAALGSMAILRYGQALLGFCPIQMLMAMTWISISTLMVKMNTFQLRNIFGKSSRMSIPERLWLLLALMILMRTMLLWLTDFAILYATKLPGSYRKNHNNNHATFHNAFRVDWEIEDETKGHMVCCSVQELHQKIPFAPDLGNADLMTNLDQ